MTTTAPAGADRVSAAISETIAARLADRGIPDPRGHFAGQLARDAMRSITVIGSRIYPAPKPTFGVSPVPPRRREVLVLVATGAGNGDIGQRLHMAEETVKTHIRRLMATFEAANRTELVFRALASGAITLDEATAAAEAGP